MCPDSCFRDSGENVYSALPASISVPVPFISVCYLLSLHCLTFFFPTRYFLSFPCPTALTRSGLIRFLPFFPLEPPDYLFFLFRAEPMAHRHLTYCPFHAIVLFTTTPSFPPLSSPHTVWRYFSDSLSVFAPVVGSLTPGQLRFIPFFWLFLRFFLDGLFFLLCIRFFPFVMFFWL